MPVAAPIMPQPLAGNAQRSVFKSNVSWSITAMNISPTSRSRLQIATLLVFATLLTACGINNIPTLDEQAKAAWGQVQNQYQRRADLIPNLVETVKGYAAHEQETLTAVIE